jgi:hypothetical protein
MKMITKSETAYADEAQLEHVLHNAKLTNLNLLDLLRRGQMSGAAETGRLGGRLDYIFRESPTPQPSSGSTPILSRLIMPVLSRVLTPVLSRVLTSSGRACSCGVRQMWRSTENGWAGRKGGVYAMRSERPEDVESKRRV